MKCHDRGISTVRVNERDTKLFHLRLTADVKFNESTMVSDLSTLCISGACSCLNLASRTRPFKSGGMIGVEGGQCSGYWRGVRCIIS